MTPLYYLLEANSYLMVFYGFYKLFLRRETFYMLSRFYLLFTGLLAFVLPGFRVGGLKPLAAAVPVEYVSAGPVPVPVVQTAPVFWTPVAMVAALYLVVVLFFLIRLGIRLFNLLRLVKGNEVRVVNGCKKIELPGKNASFSFLNYLFIDPQLPDTDTIIRHEMIHIRQHHTVDVLFFELLQIFNWFNPVIPFLKKEIRELHEFIADEKTLSEERDVERYALFLIHHSYDSLQQELGNQMFDELLLKKRIGRLFQERSKPAAKWKHLVVVPLLLLMVCLSSLGFAKDYAIDLMPSKQVAPQAIAVTQAIAAKKAITARPGSYPALNIDARTDTVKIRAVPGKRSDDYNGIYVIDNKIYSVRELRLALDPAGKMDIVLPGRPMLGFYTPHDTNAIRQWGKRAENGVIFVVPRKDSKNRP